MEHSYYGPLGTLVAGLGMGAFYVALIWINSLLGMFLTPLIVMPIIGLLDSIRKRHAK